MNFSYDYTRLLVTDLKACFQFYRNVMGFKPSYGTENDNYASFDAGTLTIALFKRELMAVAVGSRHLPDQPSVQDRVCLVFGGEDVDAACNQLVQQGVSLVTEPTDHPDWGIRAAHFRDPDGNLIEIYRDLPHENTGS